MHYLLKRYPWQMGILALIIAALDVGTMALMLIVGSFPREHDLFNAVTIDAYFGAQIVVLSVIAIFFILRAILRKQLIYAIPGLIITAGIAAVTVPAIVIQETRYYIVGEGGPAGPVMTCLGWQPTVIGYLQEPAWVWNSTCLTLNIPSYNKYLLVRNISEERELLPYVASLATGEGILLAGIGGALYANSRLTRAKQQDGDKNHSQDSSA